MLDDSLIDKTKLSVILFITTNYYYYYYDSEYYYFYYYDCFLRTNFHLWILLFRSSIDKNMGHDLFYRYKIIVPVVTNIKHQRFNEDLIKI